MPPSLFDKMTLVGFSCGTVFAARESQVAAEVARAPRAMLYPWAHAVATDRMIQDLRRAPPAGEA